jgi:ankyrin repeat protein
MVAIRLQDEPTIRFLLENGADPNTQDTNGETAMMKVVCTHAPDAPRWVDLLLSKGADRTIKDNSGYTALDLAKRCNCDKAVELLSH